MASEGRLLAPTDDVEDVWALGHPLWVDHLEAEAIADALSVGDRAPLHRCITGWTAPGATSEEAFVRTLPILHDAAAMLQDPLTLVAILNRVHPAPTGATNLTTAFIGEDQQREAIEVARASDDATAALLRVFEVYGPTPPLLDALWAAVDPASSTDELGRLWFALETAGEADRTRFFRACARPTLTLPVDWVDVRPGSFRMGNLDDDETEPPVERPAHEVTLSEGFLLMRTQVTVALYRRFDPLVRGPANHPVTGLNWYQARRSPRG
jgi:hypothetical protein